MLKTKSSQKPREESDGLRISVMSRHSTIDAPIPHYDEWIKSLSSPLILLGDYYKRGLPWEEVEKRYLEYIRQPDIRIEVMDLAKRSLDSVITLLCYEKTTSIINGNSTCIMLSS